MLRIDSCSGTDTNRSSLSSVVGRTKLIISWRIFFSTDGGFAKNMADIGMPNRVLRGNRRSIGDNAFQHFRRYGSISTQHRQNQAVTARESAPMPIALLKPDCLAVYTPTSNTFKIPVLDGGSGSANVRCDKSAKRPSGAAFPVWKSARGYCWYGNNRAILGETGRWRR